MHTDSTSERTRRFVQDGTKPRLPYCSVAAFWAVFLGDLDEPRATQFRKKLIPIFKSSWEVKRAYLTEFEFPTGGTGRGLCLKISFGDEEAISNKVHSIFASLYTRDEYLDLMFLDKKQEAEVRKACTPFFERVDEAEDFRNRMPRHTTGLTARVCPHCASRQHGIHRAVRMAKQGEGDSGWQFFCNSGAAEESSEAHTVPLWRVLEKEPLLLRWLDADEGTTIWRLTAKDPWEAWKDGKLLPLEKPGPGKNGRNGNGQNGHHGNGTNGHYTNGANGHYTNGNGVHRNGAKDAEPESNGHYTNGQGTNGANGNGTNGAYHAAERPKRFAEYEQADDSPRQYLKLQSGSYPVGDELYYECYSCGDALPSLSPSGTKCRCGNFSVSQGTGRILIRNEAKIRVFRQG